MSGPAKAGLTVRPLSQSDRDRARLAVATAALDAADAMTLLAALGLDGPAEIADHLTRRTAASQTGAS
ncbi:hypothetical protein [Kitasatospora indigofera]|uniref:hypothetical protein n=1 Tax=Kitasatospora indigofera TaxID=67307 RepID=UPI0036C35CF0